MTACIVEGLCLYGSWQILGLLNPNNEKNISRWTDIKSKAGEECLNIDFAATETRKFQALRSRLFKRKQHLLLKQIQSFSPDLLLVIQGNIEQSCSVFFLKKYLKCPIISYIPLPHKHAEMGAKLGTIRDLTCKRLYGIPDGFITISVTLAEMLRAYGARKQKIQVVENGIPLEPYADAIEQKDVRKQLGLPEDGFLWGQAGRVEFKQKGQDMSLRVFCERAKTHPDEFLVILGSGPDDEMLKRLVENMPNVYYLPWMSDPVPFYSAIDALMLPSRYEGVPLVMLEALANKKPVISTDRDGMCDWLPPEWRFAYRNVKAMLQCCENARNADGELLERLKNKIYTSHSIVSLQKSFNAALEEWR